MDVTKRYNSTRGSYVIAARAEELMWPKISQELVSSVEVEARSLETMLSGKSAQSVMAVAVHSKLPVQRVRALA